MTFFEKAVSVPLQTGSSPPVVINGNQVVAWVLAIVAWVLICSGAWFAATRADYAKLAEVRVCYDASGRSHSTLLQCENIKPSDALFYKSEIDRKARISRLAAAFGAMVAAIVIISTRRTRRATRA
jgi:hypothetical protein